MIGAMTFTEGARGSPGCDGLRAQLAKPLDLTISAARHTDPDG
jgi:hypothetical protein